MPIGEPQDSQVFTYTITGEPTENGTSNTRFTLTMEKTGDGPATEDLDHRAQELVTTLSTLRSWYIVAERSTVRTWPITPTPPEI